MQRALLARHADDDLVAFGAAGARTARDLLHDAAIIAAALPEAPKGAQVLFVFRNDRYALAASLLAALARGFSVALPPELSREALTLLAQAPETAGVLHDTASGIAVQVGALLAEGRQARPLARTDLDASALIAKVYAPDKNGTLETRASDQDWLAQARAVGETLGWPPLTRCAASVGPGHAYGIVLGVLLPLLSGAAFLREALEGSELNAAIEHQAIDTLVSVPVHLQALFGAATKTRAPSRVISGLSPMPADLSVSLEAAGALVTDLAVALILDVPVLQVAARDDVVQTSQGPRTTREIERTLRLEAGVSDAAVVALPHAAPFGSMAQLCVAYVGQDSALRVRSALREALGPAAERADILELGAIRRDGVGDFDRSELLRRFGLRPNGEPVSVALRWGDARVERLEDSTEHTCSVDVPADYAYFDGHFPGYPILPGAAQLSELVLPFVRRVEPAFSRLKQMSRLKFSGRIQPGETIDVVLTLRADAHSVDFALRRGKTVCAAGTLQFADEGAP